MGKRQGRGEKEVGRKEASMKGNGQGHHRDSQLLGGKFGLPSDVSGAFSVSFKQSCEVVRFALRKFPCRVVIELEGLE